MGTRQSPSCYHGAAQHFSEITGIYYKKEIRVNTMAELRTKGSKSRLRYQSYDILVIDQHGRQFAYMQAGPKRFDQCGIIADHFIVSVRRTLAEFGIEYKPAGNYKDCLGGGWHSNIPMFEHNGFFFAPDMECAC